MYKSVEELRELFPVCRQWTYLYNGSIHPCPVPVREAIVSFLSDWEACGEAAVLRALDQFQELKHEFAELIGTDDGNIVITESTSAGITTAGHILQPRTDQNVVVTDLAFMSNTYPWLTGQLAKADVRFVPSRDGRIDVAEIAARIDEATAFIHICAVTVAGGFRYDMSEISELAAANNIPLIIDAAQALGLIDIKVCTTPVDFLAATASKWLMGPTGIGFLYVADQHLNALPPNVGWFAASNVADWDVHTCVLHNDAQRFQGGIPNLLGVVGALAGIRLLKQIGTEFIADRTADITGYLLDGLESMDLDIVTPHRNTERAGLVFFRPPNPAELHARLKAEHIYCGCFQNGIRVDPTFYNTYQEIDKFLAVVNEHIEGLKNSCME